MGRRPGMDDFEIEMQPAAHAHGDGHKTTVADDCRYWCILVVCIFLLAPCIFIPIDYYAMDTQYSVAIDSVSGADLSFNTTAGLSFNLTLAVASRSHGAKSCIIPGTYVEVSYRGAKLAASVAETRRLCAGPRKAAERRVMALVTGVPVGNVLRSLTDDMTKGVAAFDATLNLPAGSYGGRDGAMGWASQCNGMRLGEAAVPCDSPNQEPIW